MQLLLALLLPAVALGAVEQVTDQNTFKRILAENPAVVVDFFSQSCGPCIMIAPKYKELAKEYEGRVRFLKVDVQQHNVGVQVRSMPTFHFYFQGKLDHQFSGADENGMRQQTQQLDRKAEAADVEVSLGALEAFYKEHDPSKLDNVDEIYEKYPAYKLVAILKKKYGKAPEFTKKNSRKQAPKAEAGGKADAGGDKPVDIRKMDMDDLKAEVRHRRPHSAAAISHHTAPPPPSAPTAPSTLHSSAPPCPAGVPPRDGVAREGGGARPQEERAAAREAGAHLGQPSIFTTTHTVPGIPAEAGLAACGSRRPPACARRPSGLQSRAAAAWAGASAVQPWSLRHHSSAGLTSPHLTPRHPTSPRLTSPRL